MTGSFFFWGTLCHLPLLRTVLGRDVPVRAATLPGWHTLWAADADYPVLRPGDGVAAPGVLVTGLSAADRDRLAFYEGGFRYAPVEKTVRGADGAALAAQVFLAEDAGLPVAGPWRLADWAERWGATAEATARDTMALYGRKPAADVARRRGLMLVRGASRARAEAEPAPATLRRGAAAGDVAVEDRREPYAAFFAIEEYDLRYRRFDGTLSAPVSRAAFVSGDAVVVLPYDPHRDRVLVVEQFRVGAFARGDRNPWSIEGIAGRVDPGETPEKTARREAVEEAGLELGELVPVHHHYPSPGGKTEFIYTYVALGDLPDAEARIGGLPGEGEDIRSHIIPFGRLMDLLEAGEINNGPLTILALWLARERPRLRAALGTAP